MLETKDHIANKDTTQGHANSEELSIGSEIDARDQRWCRLAADAGGWGRRAPTSYVAQSVVPLPRNQRPRAERRSCHPLWWSAIRFVSLAQGGLATYCWQGNRPAEERRFTAHHASRCTGPIPRSARSVRRSSVPMSLRRCPRRAGYSSTLRARSEARASPFSSAGPLLLAPLPRRNRMRIGP